MLTFFKECCLFVRAEVNKSPRPDILNFFFLGTLIGLFPGGLPCIAKEDTKIRRYSLPTKLRITTSY